MTLQLARRTVAQQVASALRDRILAGEFADGEPLRQDAVALDFGVSRIPVREALGLLEAEGLVTSLPHRGAVVALLSGDEIAELFEMRAALEPLLLRRAIPRHAAGDFAAAASALAALDAALATDDATAWSRLNWRFHEALYRSAGRPRMFRLVQELNNNGGRYVRLHLGMSGAIARARDDHETLLALCRRGEIAAAADLLERHITSAGEELAGFVAARHAATADATRKAS